MTDDKKAIFLKIYKIFIEALLNFMKYWYEKSNIFEFF